ncbi:catalytic subunit of N-acetyltransferase [Dimargaris cristalligena]|uniref:Catalytic subunit of N-acetyltransferase n=1 Tax=Dimargaris cristalligena TaxID=215637 RepID=A0A4P9ZW33_9FUNG|nr:catalytic subunit of N-acetyltransferase [Dimargaris cristalligena]|eukprot:RKP37834.1 catalytic subunit of N-acetyltransferase [Dimargaris cristalligena]
MTTIRRFSALDLFSFNNINLDVFTENYTISFYLQYLAKWPGIPATGMTRSARTMGYMMGKVEGIGRDWHGHVTAVTVAPEYRRLGLARRLMALLEDATDRVYSGYFVDLFVRKSNHLAVNMYKRLGYVVYRRVIGYYSSDGDDPEDAYDMRKAMSRDTHKLSMIPLKHPVRPEDVWN